MLHALCFYIFQVVYPPTISLLAPPARVSIIAPSSDEARTFLNWLEAEDPALASQTQRPVGARAFQLPKLAHIPSYTNAPPRLNEMPPLALKQSAPSAMPPEPVPTAPALNPPSPRVALTTLSFSEMLRELPISQPDLKFHASSREAPESARFRIAVDSAGVVRHCFLEHSSGDPALDEQARHHLALCRFAAGDRWRASGQELTWATATIDFGNDLQLPPAMERAP